MHDVKERPTVVERAMLIGVTLPDDTTSNTRSLLDELREFVDTLGFGIRHERKVSLRKPQAQLLVGHGKAQELVHEAKAHDCDAVPFHYPL